jgi:hypothetical protein
MNIETQKKIIDLYNKNNSAGKTAEIMECSKPQVIKVLEANNIKLNHQGAPIKKNFKEPDNGFISIMIKSETKQKIIEISEKTGLKIYSIIEKAINSFHNNLVNKDH